MVYYPIFGDRQDQYLQQIVDVKKDVEGLSHKYIFNMYQNIRYLDSANTKKSILPCTPLAIIKILEYLQIYNTILPEQNRLHGRTITVINRSEVVGRPLAAILANDGARVYSVDVKDVQEFSRGAGLKKRRHEAVEKVGWTMKDCLPISDIVISGVPGDNFKVPLELLRDGAVCINFSSEKNFESVGVKEKASIYIPAIGKMTIVVLLRNLLVSLGYSLLRAWAWAELIFFDSGSSIIGRMRRRVSWRARVSRAVFQLVPKARRKRQRRSSKTSPQQPRLEQRSST